MVVGYADAPRLDRFTTRYRVPASRIRARPSHMSQYVIVRASASVISTHKRTRDTLFICRAALDNGDTGDDAVFAGPLRFDASVRMAVASPLVFANLGGEDAGYKGEDAFDVQWIPKSKIRNAVAVTLEVCISVHKDDGNENATVVHDTKKVAEWLCNAQYRQLLIETLQHHFLVCLTAVVQLPLPSSSTGIDQSKDAVLEFKVVSVYPEEKFVRITPNTRVTFSTDSIAIDDDGIVQDLTASNSIASHNAPKIGGLEKEQAALREMILLPVEYAGLSDCCGIEFPKGLLLCGPPGVGKTLLVRTIVHECSQQVPLRLKTINGAEILTSGVGDAETTLRSIFTEAAEFARTTKGASVIFIDELDALCPKRDSSGASAHSRIVAQLLTLLDGADKQARGNVVIVGATNLPNSIDAALRRPGRFDRELFIAPPNITARKKIFQMNLQEMPICVNGFETEKHEFFETLATKSIGYVGADIAALCREALAVATTRQFVAMAKDRELDTWWSEWKRHSNKPLYNANFSVVVSGNAWKANPIAIPLWFFAKQSAAHEQQQDHVDTSELNASKPPTYFSFLLQNGAKHVSPSAAVDDASISNASELQYPDIPERKGDERSAAEPPAFEVTMADFEQAMQVIVASSLRGAAGFAKDFEKLGWDSIGGQEHTKLALQQALEWPIKFPQTFTRLGVKPPRGILLYGPPGCSKSSIVRAAAHSSGATFLTLSAAKVFSPFFGDAEASVRQVFRDARAALPAILFLDEIDVLVAKRQFDGSGGGESGSSSAMRVLSTLLNEMDGVEAAEGLLVIGATNRPDCIDAALLRPGRFDRILYVDLPREADRLKILQIHSKPMQLADDVDLAKIAAQTEFFSGAELENVCREAALHALRESIHAKSVRMQHFEAALETISPVSSPKSLQQYVDFAQAMGHLS
uniref:AAA+ ATPase domain-containing protein n=1 Tax=Globisporangium ultimum (strain ATCC 200006 / CBS 805.95 / DAOM BR144) TaxID=431595 RepID=K3WUV6_GLOUD